jgi:glutathione S-transferase
MSLTFYRAPQSTATMTECVLAELGTPHEVVTLDLSKGDGKKADFRAVNPNGRVPTIVHDGVSIWESSAICMYLGETFGVEKGLYPKPGPRRGEAMKWICWTNVTLGEQVSRWARNTMQFAPEEQRNAKAGEAGKQDLTASIQVLDEALAGKQFLLGDYTLADCHVCSFIGWMRMLKFDFAPYPNINAWGERVLARDGYRKVMTAAVG